MTRGWLLLVALLAVGRIVPAQAGKEIEGYSSRIWQTPDGLPEETVQAIAQTPDRYLWIGTTGGLVRFDGAQFAVFERDNTPAFRENSVYCLRVTSDSSLWIGTEGGGIIRYRDGHFKSYSTSEGLTNGFVRAIYEDRDHRLWVGTDKGLFQLQKDRLVHLERGIKDPIMAVHSIAQDQQGRLWVGGSSLVSLVGDEATECHLEGAWAEKVIKTIFQTSDGTIYLASVAGLLRLDRLHPDGRADVTRIKQVDRTVRAFQEFADGTLWMGTIGGGLVRRIQGEFSKLTAPATLPSNTVFAIFEDVEQNIWVGTQTGLLRLSRTAVNSYALPGAADADFGTVSADGNVLWVASNHLFRFSGKEFAEFHFPGRLANAGIRNVFRARDGALWVGTNGYGTYRQTRGESVPKLVQGVDNDFIRVFAEGRDGAIWIGTDGGLGRWSPQGTAFYRASNSRLCYGSIRALLADRQGDLWVGTDRGISRLRGNEFLEDGLVMRLREERVWAIYEDSEGGLWFGTRGSGLFLWKHGKLHSFTTATGLAGNTIYCILEDRLGSLWMSGPDGISSVRRRDLEETAEKPGRRLAVTLYGISDGLETTQMYGGIQPAGSVTDRGEIWFASDRGPVRIAPIPVQRSSPPPPVINRVMADGHEVPVLNGVSIQPGGGKLEVYYSAIRLRSQERVRFKYMLEGLDEQWTETLRRRVAYYTRIPPGKYRFRVLAFDMNQPENTSETSLSFELLPHFYERSWFLAACIGLVLLAIWGVHRMRMQQARTRFAAVLEERNRMAREMHDTLIQGCAGVSALLEASSALGESAPEVDRELIDYARAQIRDIIEDARRAVWNLRHGTPAPGQLVPMLSQLAQLRGAESNIPVVVESSGEPYDVDTQVGYELLRIADEALHNALRHGQPSKVILRLCFEASQLRLVALDDGCGFEPALAGAAQGHFGLVGMRERSERLGGAFHLISTPGGGTEIEVTIPSRSNGSPQ